jgi:hypothetical protein
MSPGDLAVLNRYLTLIKRRKSPAQAEEITAAEYGLTDLQLARILKTTEGAKYVARTIEKLTPTKAIIRSSTITTLLDVLTFNMMDCYHDGTFVPKPLDQMPIDAQSAVRGINTDKYGNVTIDFYSRIEAAKALAALDAKGKLDILDEDNKPKTKRGMFDHMKCEAPVAGEAINDNSEITGEEFDDNG